MCMRTNCVCHVTFSIKAGIPNLPNIHDSFARISAVQMSISRMLRAKIEGNTNEDEFDNIFKRFYF